MPHERHTLVGDIHSINKKSKFSIDHVAPIPVIVYYLEYSAASEDIGHGVNNKVVVQFLLEEREEHPGMLSERGHGVHDGTCFIAIL